MPHRYFVQLSYNGTRYHGWQMQPNATSIQQDLINAFSTLLREPIELTGAGRTDTGVHASYYIAHFDSENSELEGNQKIIFKLNCILPADIAIQKIYKVKDNAHARFDATSRSYKYFIEQQKNPFTEEFAWHMNLPLNVETMNVAAVILKEYNDFTSFSKLHSDNKTNLCNIGHSQWTIDGNKLTYSITADRFLRNMVRAIVGTLVDVGLGKINIEQFRHIIDTKDRGLASASAPAKGLFLVDVVYG